MHGEGWGGRRRRTAWIGPLLVVAALLAGCSSSSDPAPGIVGAGHAASANAATCHPATTAVPASTPVAGIPSDWVVTSFDGTPIRVHWFPVSPSPGDGTTAPTVLMGPGWSLAGDTDTQGTGILGAVPIKSLWTAGYNVLTWDPRGFGKSGGVAEVDSPHFEARDVSTLISWVAGRPGVELDTKGDPRMGMVGGSYGGGIQLVTAATDCRVDAIVPGIAWHSLVTSLDKADTVKSGWSNLLTALSATDRVDPEVIASHAAGEQNGVITPAQQHWFAERGPGTLVAHIHVPTLIVQGTVDTLFTLQEGVDNYHVLRGKGVPTSMVWFCGGHGVCLTPPGNPDLVLGATLAWLDRYVKQDTAVHTGPGFRFVDQNGTQYSAPSYPPTPGRPVTASGRGTLPLVAAGGSGPVDVSRTNQILAGLVASITPGPATTAVTLPIPFGSRSAVVVGAPRLVLSYQGTASAGTRPTRVFAQLVDPSTGLVLGNQVTPIAVTLDGRPHATAVPLEMVAYTGHAHTSLELQVVATTVAYAQPQLGGSVHFTHIEVTLPVATIAPR